MSPSIWYITSRLQQHRHQSLTSPAITPTSPTTVMPAFIAFYTLLSIATVMAAPSRVLQAATQQSAKAETISSGSIASSGLSSGSVSGGSRGVQAAHQQVSRANSDLELTSQGHGAAIGHARSHGKTDVLDATVLDQVSAKASSASDVSTIGQATAQSNANGQGRAGTGQTRTGAQSGSSTASALDGSASSNGLSLGSALSALTPGGVLGASSTKTSGGAVSAGSGGARQANRAHGSTQNDGVVTRSSSGLYVDTIGDGIAQSDQSSGSESAVFTNGLESRTGTISSTDGSSRSRGPGASTSGSAQSGALANDQQDGLSRSGAASQTSASNDGDAQAGTSGLATSAQRIDPLTGQLVRQTRAAVSGQQESAGSAATSTGSRGRALQGSGDGAAQSTAVSSGNTVNNGALTTDFDTQSATLLDIDSAFPQLAQDIVNPLPAAAQLIKNKSH